ncbi:Alpha/Beta hydrolase protein [Amylocystis lapponica]|nr:Alpha/Beta hydrolase protein [Amylocystis lapponica]
MVYEYQHQPLKSLYLGYQIVKTCLFRIPFWCLHYAFSFLRPRPTWTFRMSFDVAFNRLLSAFGTIAEKYAIFPSSSFTMLTRNRAGQFRSWPTYLAMPDDPTAKGVWLDARPTLVVGDVKAWAMAADVVSVRIPGYWLDKTTYDTPISEKPVPGEKVVYYLHGGGYMSESAHPSSFMSMMPRMALDCCPAAKRAFSIEYRNCDLGTSQPSNPFPAALIDSIVGYHYLSETVGFSPDDIIVMGDSAGANLTLALTRYLVDNRAELSTYITGLASSSSVASGLILISPWVDLGTSHETPGSSLLANTCDFLPDMRVGLLGAARRAFVGPLGMAGANSNAYLSPASIHADMGKVSFKGFPRSFIIAGDADRLFDEGVSLKDKMVCDLGLGREGVTFIQGQDGTHDYLLLFPSSPVTRRTLAELGLWFS